MSSHDRGPPTRSEDLEAALEELREIERRREYGSGTRPVPEADGSLSDHGSIHRSRQVYPRSQVSVSTCRLLPGDPGVLRLARIPRDRKVIAAFLYWEWRASATRLGLHDQVLLVHRSRRGRESGERGGEGRRRAVAKVQGVPSAVAGQGSFQPWTHQVFRADVGWLFRAPREGARAFFRPDRDLEIEIAFAAYEFEPELDSRVSQRAVRGDAVRAVGGAEAAVPMCAGASLVLVLEAPVSQRGTTVLYDPLGELSAPAPELAADPAIRSALPRRELPRFQLWEQRRPSTLELPGLVPQETSEMHWVRVSSLRQESDPWRRWSLDRFSERTVETEHLELPTEDSLQHSATCSRVVVRPNARATRLPELFGLRWFDVLWFR